MKRNILPWIGLTLAIFLVLLSWSVMSGHADFFDLPLRQALLARDPANASNLWHIVSYLGSSVVITALSVVIVTLFSMRVEWQQAKQLTFVMVGAVVIENSLKLLVHRARPDEIFAHTMPSTYSFPSGHALFSLAFYGSIAMIATRQLHQSVQIAVGVAVVLLVLLIGVSRIFLGVHYPTDVLGGYVSAALWMVIVQLFLRARK